MADDERRDDEQQPQEAEEPQAEEQAPEPETPQPEAEQPQEPEGEAEQPQPEAEQPQPEAEQPQEGQAEEPQAEAKEPAEEPAARQRRREPEAKEKKPEQPPGAELEPIAIEPERELSAEERARAEAEAEERARREAEATAEAGDEPVARRRPTVEFSGDVRIQATGKRKSSIARVVVQPGSGSFEVNSKPVDEYFHRHFHQTLARQPLVTSGYEGTVDVRVRVQGGGVSGQAGAVRHGVARALVEIDGELRSELKRRGLLTRDARRKERRKAGLKKARKRPQFSKR